MSEEFFTYIEIDPDGRISKTQTRVTFTNLLDGDNQVLLYKDKGVAYFNGNFTHDFDFTLTAASLNGRIGACWALTNDLDDIQGLIDGSKDALFFYANRLASGAFNWHLAELDGGTLYESGTPTNPGGGLRYFRITRDESVSTFGNLYVKVYNDAARTDLFWEANVTLHTSKKDFRYIIPIVSYDGTVNPTAYYSGYVENLMLLGALTPVVTQEPLTDIASTTVTGNGTIVSPGGAAVTQHGHCWNTAVNPTTANSKTTNGAAGLGTFTSAITGLTPGTTYYIRAYATNSYGTAYSAEEITYVAGSTTGTKMPREIYIVGSNLMFVDQYGVEHTVAVAI